MISKLDYTLMEWEKVMKQFDIQNFLSLTFSTISLFETIIRWTKLAEAIQWAYNMILMQLYALLGPAAPAVITITTTTADVFATVATLLLWRQLQLPSLDSYRAQSQ